MERLEAEQLGIDLSMVSICKRIRRLAKLERITLDMSQHRSGLNTHLFSYIEYCGYDVLEFIKMYLSRLQPYMIQRRKDQEKERFICVIDSLYKISVYIKIDDTQFDEVIVSFHEDNKRGIAKVNNILRDVTDLVPIFADSITSRVVDTDKYTVREIFQRGIKELPLDLAARKCEDFYIVSRHAIENQFIEYCNTYLRDLYTSDLDIDFSQVDIFTVLQQISFTSLGKDAFSSISLLIDSLNIQHDKISKGVADFALVTYVQALQLDDSQQSELISMLQEKFSVSAVKSIDLILDRIMSLLSTSGGSIYESLQRVDDSHFLR